MATLEHASVLGLGPGKANPGLIVFHCVCCCFYLFVYFSIWVFFYCTGDVFGIIVMLENEAIVNLMLYSMMD